MKLIKQNDSAGGLIFKQNQNGKAMKQNYNFGKFFSSHNAFGTFDIILDEAIISGQPFSIGAYLRVHPNTTATGGGVSLFFSDTSVNNLSFRRLNKTTIEVRYAGVSFGSQPIDRLLFLIAFDGVKARLWLGSSYSSQEVDPLLTDINNITVRTVNNENTAYLINNIFLFDKPLSVEEASYLTNNRLGNDFLSENGLRYNFKLNSAEILNTGGSDFVGVRDRISNLHKPITGLPAGTLQEQLEFANQNLFI